MQAPVGPSLQLLMLMADAFAEVSVAAVGEVWERWIGPQRFARKLAQFERLGWIETPPAAANVTRVVRVTDTGRLVALGGRNPEVCWRRAWDGRWRLVMFDLPESQRALRIKLRRKLRALGFGYLQNSVWTSPDSATVLTEIARGATINVETLSFMEARPCGGETDADIVAGAWDFARINRNYAQYLELLDNCPSHATGGKAARNWLDTEWRAWRRALNDDPLLPEALLPPEYRGREAWSRRTEKLRALLARR